MNLRKNQSGFSIVEIIAALGVTCLVGLSLAASFQLMGGAKKGAENHLTDMTNASTVGSNFPSFVEQANPSIQFLHLPVNRTCADASTACIRVFDAATNGFKNPTSELGKLTTVTSFEFYRDDNAKLNPDFLITKRDALAAPANVTQTVKLDVSPVAGKEVYATWPMLDETAEPFPMLIRQWPVRYVVPGHTAKSDASGNIIFLKTQSGAMTDADTSALVGNLMVFFNGEDPRQYVVKAIKAINRCASNMAACQALVDPAYIAAVRAEDVRMEMQNVSSGMLSSFLPTDTVLNFEGAWPTDSSTIKFFPNQSPNISESTIDYFVGNTFNPRKLLHYYHSAGIPGDLYAIPLSLISFKIEKQPSSTQLNLVKSNFNLSSGAVVKQTVVPDISGPMVFARELGTSRMKLVMFDTSKQQPSDPKLSKVKMSFQGTVLTNSFSATPLNRKVVSYPKKCEMTFSLQGYCGDGDVVDYYNAHPAEEYGKGKNSFKLVLGYWVEPADTSTAKPTADSWFAVGYDDVNLNASQLGLKKINSNEKMSSNTLLKDEIERVVSLARYAPDLHVGSNADDYKIYSTLMLCNVFEDTQGTLPDATFDLFSSTAPTCEASEVLAGNPAIPPFSSDPTIPGSPTPVCTPVLPSCPGGSITYEYVYVGTAPSIYTCVPVQSCPVATTAPPGGTTGGVTGGEGCFVAGTKILLKDGSEKNIEEIAVGDQVYSMNESAGIVRMGTVTKLHHHASKSQQIHNFKMSDGSSIVSNDIHPYYVVENENYFKASEIAEMRKAGLPVSLLRADGVKVSVNSVDVTVEDVPVYNFEVDGLEKFSDQRAAFGTGHNYFANGYLVHNAIYGSIFKGLEMMILGVPAYSGKMAN